MNMEPKWILAVPIIIVVVLLVAILVALCPARGDSPLPDTI